MYPNLYYLFKDIFGWNLPALKIFNTFGCCVAISFLVCAWLLVKELNRKQAAGYFTYKEEEIEVGKPASIVELLINFCLGFILGYKILALFIIKGALNDPQGFIFSTAGSFPAGVLLGLFFAALKWWEKNKSKLANPEKRNIRIWPSDRVGDITIIAAVFGFAGAKIFDNLENWDRFIQDPIGNLFSPSGLTFYGGLIVASLALWYYFKKNKISFINVADAVAPGLMFAYGWGRMGCQVAGDGDWGIVNNAFVSNADGTVQLSNSSGAFYRTLTENANYYAAQFGSIDKVQHVAVRPFWDLPNWLFAYTYPHNVNNEGIPLFGCTWDNYCNHLPIPVFPTPIYEIVVCLLLFAFLWSIRKKMITPGRMFAVYLVLNGIERFLIEHIRVNTQYHFFGINPTQAEIISLGLIIGGIALYVFAPKLKASKAFYKRPHATVTS
ncbi:MAG: prolipoprotein diacylglyceryl transferase family protein [Parafilimonas sp.]